MESAVIVSDMDKNAPLLDTLITQLSCDDDVRRLYVCINAACSNEDRGAVNIQFTGMADVLLLCKESNKYYNIFK